jgi:hypothetical protein
MNRQAWKWAASAAILILAAPAGAVPVITNVQPFKGTANTGATVDITGTGFGSLADIVQFPGPVNVNPIALIAGGVRVTAPATWSGNVYVWSGGSWSNGFAHDIYYNYSGQRWPGGGLPFTWFLNNGGAPGNTFDATRDALIAGYGAWECASGLTTSYGGGTAVATTANDGVNCRYWANSGWSPGTIAVATWWYIGADIVHADIAFNAQHYTWSAAGAAGSMDVGHIGTHEEGHTIGLLDMYGASDSDNTMYGYGANGDTHNRTLDIDDQYGAEWMYPHSRVNFTAGTPAGWYWALVPRNTADATGAYAPLPGTLTGNTASYINAAMTNNGSDCASPHGDNSIYLDDSYAWGLSWDGTWGAGATYGLWTNLGTYIRGGRHTLREDMDVANLALESNESDNVFRAQYVWSPYVLADHVPVFRSTPPAPGSLTYPNCDGFEFNLGGTWWGCVGMIPYDSNDDFDMRIHNDAPSALNGFDTFEASSAWGSGASDFVLVNGNTGGGTAISRWTGVNLWGGTNNGFYVQYSASLGSFFTPATALGPYTLNAYDIVNVQEFYFGTTGYWDVLLENLSGTANLGIALYSSTGIHYSKSDYVAFANSSGGGSNEMLSYNIPATGWYGLVVFKTGSADLGLADTYQLTVRVSPPNLRPDYAFGWDYPLVPRNDATAVDGNVHLPAQLDGNVNNTHFNLTGINDGFNAAPLNNTNLYVDGGWVGWSNWPAIGAGGRYVLLNLGTLAIRGGRHTLGWLNDQDAQVVEGNEGDNYFERQFVWSPLVIADETPVSRPAPPAWGSGAYPNSDGYQYAGASGYAWAAAICPEGAGDDYDLAVYSDYSGPESGYSVFFSGSGQLAGQTDYAGGPYWTGGTNYYPAMIHYSGGASNCDVDAADSAPAHISAVPAVWGGETLAAGRLISVFEIYVENGTTYQVDLTNVAGGADLAVAAHAPSLTSFASYTAEYFLDAAAAGGNENGSFSPAETGWYIFVAVKHGSADVTAAAVYDLSVTVSTTAAEGGLPIPEALALRQNEPNPFNPLTTIRYEVPAAGADVKIEVFDLSGHRVRTLVNGHSPAGFHSVDWDGRSDAGEALGSGVYFYRLRAGSAVKNEKMMMLK